ncbi:tRNA1(Val) (adenine(37)-N6)-methyltransferase [Hippea alviniae]|uniref:tRNA1(Val) (adenine(37)-N6)-methyltransferase n=1 Tax=Hippea alviniae TaxID=1279027 RepID=UPI0003B35805|nr:methyltransferase [Hippea alviniae]
MELELHQFSTFKIYQPKDGYRFAIEPFVLAYNLKGLKSKVFVDFGSGCGIVAVLLAKNNPESRIIAIEKNQNMIEVIKKNIQINGLCNVSVLEIEDVLTNSVDFFISNPPYFKKGAYRISKFIDEKFEEDGFLDFMIKSARRVLKNKGILKVSYHPTRFVELLEVLRKSGFGIKSILPVYGNDKSKASFLVVNAMLSGKDYVEFLPALFLNRDSSWLIM